MEHFWKMFDQRLELCFEALKCRYKHLKGVRSDVSPIHWQYGAIARLEKGETIDKLLESGYATISLGYIGLYELTYLMLGESNTTERGQQFALEVITHLKETCDRWKRETGLGFGLYGTPSEGLCDRFCKVDRAQFGVIENVTDKGWYTNSFHVDVREEIDAFSKLAYEAPFQIVSSGGCISYIEIPNLNHNVEAIEAVIKFIYDNIQYAEFNTKSDYCMECGFDGEIIVNDDYEWECPNCHNKDQTKMNVVRRTCGYLGENFWNEGKTKEIKDRVIHLN
jgi:ribonucleoside-triphosphate reductase